MEYYKSLGATNQQSDGQYMGTNRQTDRQTDRHINTMNQPGLRAGPIEKRKKVAHTTEGHRDLETESAQLAN